MTANQISYARLLEERRSHLTQEAETMRSNLAKEGETRRANDLKYAADVYGIETTAATQRRASDLNYAASIFSTSENARMRGLELQELQRHNEYTESINKMSMTESMRHNTATEQLTEKSINTSWQSTQFQGGVSILNNVVGSVTKLATAVS